MGIDGRKVRGATVLWTDAIAARARVASDESTTLRLLLRVREVRNARGCCCRLVIRCVVAGACGFNLVCFGDNARRGC